MPYAFTYTYSMGPSNKYQISCAYVLLHDVCFFWLSLLLFCCAGTGTGTGTAHCLRLVSVCTLLAYVLCACGTGRWGRCSGLRAAPAISALAPAISALALHRQRSALHPPPQRGPATRYVSDPATLAPAARPPIRLAPFRYSRWPRAKAKLLSVLTYSE